MTCSTPGQEVHQKGHHSEGVAKALRNPEARQEATKAYGIQWLTDSKEKEL